MPQGERPKSPAENVALQTIMQSRLRAANGLLTRARPALRPALSNMLTIMEGRIGVLLFMLPSSASGIIWCIYCMGMLRRDSFVPEYRVSALRKGGHPSREPCTVGGASWFLYFIERTML